MPKSTKTTKRITRSKHTTKRKYVRKTKTSRKPKTPRRKYHKHHNHKEQKPIVLYSKDPVTGVETIAKADMTNKEGVKTYFASVESKLPPTVYKTNDGSQFMTMNEKRAIVVESFKNNRK
jgi:hypothetical protein